MGGLEGVRGRRALVVASTGGHLTQAVRWHERLDLHEDSHFVTFDNAQSRSLLSAHPHSWVPYVAPRDWAGIRRCGTHLLRLQRSLHADVLLSTGAGVALSCLAPHLGLRTPFYYIESVSRFDGPSLSGRVLSAVPTVHRGTQHENWASRRWPFVGSLLDGYSFSDAQRPRPADGARRIFVSLGTIRPYRFDSLVDRVLALVGDGDEVTWQLGATERDGLPGTVHRYVSAPEYADLARSADVVVTQAGIGGIMDLLDLGVSPVVVPRRVARGEHVDDHQAQAARVVSERGLALSLEADQIDSSALRPRGRIERLAT